MIIVRLAGLVFALIEGVLTLRLLLPFFRVSESLESYVPTLLDWSDTLVAPFRSFIEPYDLSDFTRLPGGADFGFGEYVNRLDPAVLVAIVGWGLVAALAMFLIRTLVRPSA